MRCDLGRPTRGTGQQKLSTEGRKSFPHARQAVTWLKVGPAGPCVDDADPQGLIHAQQDCHFCVRGVFERVGHRLQGEEVGRGQHSLGHRR